MYIYTYIERERYVYVIYICMYIIRRENDPGLGRVRGLFRIEVLLESSEPLALVIHTLSKLRGCKRPPTKTN